MRLKYCLELAPAATEAKGLSEDDLVSFAPMEAIDNGLGGLSGIIEKPLLEVASGSYNFFRDGDLLLAKVTPCFENGKKAIASGLKNGVGYATSEVFVVRPRDVEPRYLNYLFSSEQFRQPAVASMTGTGGLKRVDPDAIKNFELPISDKYRQGLIADFLDDQCGRAEALIFEKQQFIDLLKEKRQALISHVVTKGLDPNVEMKDSEVDWIGEIPEHWTRKRLKHVISLIESGTSVNAANVQADPNQVAVLKTSSVYGGKFDPSKTKTVIDEDVSRVSCPLRKGSLIVSRMNTPDLVGAAGYVFDAPENIFLPDRLWQVEFNSATLPEFIYYWTLTDVYRNQVKISCEGTSSSMQNISQGDFKNYHVAVPSLEEQIFIVGHVRSRASFIEKLIAEVNHSIDLLKEHRTALISSAVTGKIDLRDKEVA